MHACSRAEPSRAALRCTVLCSVCACRLRLPTRARVHLTRRRPASLLPQAMPACWATTLPRACQCLCGRGCTGPTYSAVTTRRSRASGARRCHGCAAAARPPHRLAPLPAARGCRARASAALPCLPACSCACRPPQPARASPPHRPAPAPGASLRAAQLQHMQHKVVTLALALEMLALPKDLGLNPATGGLGGPALGAAAHRDRHHAYTHKHNTHTRTSTHTRTHARTCRGHGRPTRPARQPSVAGHWPAR